MLDVQLHFTKIGSYMLVGVNIIGFRRTWGACEDLFLGHVLEEMSKLERSTRFILFTDAENHESFPDYQRKCLDDIASLDRACQAEQVDLVFTSVNTDTHKFRVPVVLYAMELWNLGHNGVQNKRRAQAQLKLAKACAAAARASVVPSEFVKNEFHDLLGVPLNKIVVAPLGVDHAFEDPHESIVEPPYLLTVGHTRAFRNIPRLLQAYERISVEFPHTLVVVGQPGEAEEKDWGPRVVRADTLPKAHLAGLYQHCAVCIIPSVYEGSGFTVLEAMKAGAVITAGRIGGIAEVAEDQPIYFNPESVDSIVGAVRRAINLDEDDRQRRIKFGRQLASDFTWERCAWQTLSAFRKAETA